MPSVGPRETTPGALIIFSRRKEQSSIRSNWGNEVADTSNPNSNAERALANLLQYAQIAAAVYKTEQEMMTALVTGGQAGWSVRFWQAGTASNGFQGAILENDQEVICAYKGSKFGVTGKQDWLVNDVQIAINAMPSQTHSAAEMVAVAQAYISGPARKPISIVGHSLGGGLAQIVGYLRGVPFITFNAPGCKGNIELIPGLSFTKPKAGGQKVNGFNMILGTDPVGNFGRHLGKTERFINRGKGVAHKMQAVLGTLAANQSWSAKLLHQLV